MADATKAMKMPMLTNTTYVAAVDKLGEFAVFAEPLLTHLTLSNILMGVSVMLVFSGVLHAIPRPTLKMQTNMLGMPGWFIRFMCAGLLMIFSGVGFHVGHAQGLCAVSLCMGGAFISAEKIPDPMRRPGEMMLSLLALAATFWVHCQCAATMIPLDFACKASAFTPQFPGTCALVLAFVIVMRVSGWVFVPGNGGYNELVSADPETEASSRSLFGAPCVSMPGNGGNSELVSAKIEAGSSSVLDASWVSVLGTGGNSELVSPKSEASSRSVLEDSRVSVLGIGGNSEPVSAKIEASFRSVLEASRASVPGNGDNSELVSATTQAPWGDSSRSVLEASSPDLSVALQSGEHLKMSRAIHFRAFLDFSSRKHAEIIDHTIHMFQQHRADMFAIVEEYKKREEVAQQTSLDMTLSLSPSADCLDGFMQRLSQEVDEFAKAAGLSDWKLTCLSQVLAENLEELKQEEMCFVNANEDRAKNPISAKVIEDIASNQRLFDEHAAQNDSHKESFLAQKPLPTQEPTVWGHSMNERYIAQDLSPRGS